MKKIYTLFASACIIATSFGQTIFQSNLSSWAAGDPTDWMGSTTSITSANVTELTTGATYGTSMASLVNATTTHKRFTTQPVTVVAGETYQIQLWVAAQTSGELRTNYYDVTNAAYGTYNSYIDVAAASGGNLTLITQNVTVPATSTSVEFIVSIRNTDPLTAPFNIGILIDSVAISVTTPPAPTIKKIYDIQYTTNPNGDSPELGNVVTTRGIITGIVKNGPDRHSFFIQDSASAWNGLYIYETNDSTLVIGDSVEVTGTVDEFNLGSASQKVTELKFVSNITVLNSGNTLPTPVSISTANANMEEWEGVLIHLTNAECMSNTLGFGMWSVDDGSGVIKADDDIFAYHFTAVVGTDYNVTGIGHYTFDEYKILPRDVNDISIATSINELEKSTVAVYPNPAKDVLTFELAISNFDITITDITGKVVKSFNSSNNKKVVGVANLNNGIYFYTITSNGSVIATNKFVVTK